MMALASVQVNRHAVHFALVRILSPVLYLVSILLCILVIVGPWPLDLPYGVFMKYVAGEGSTAVGSQLQGSITYGLTGVCIKPSGDEARQCFRTYLGVSFDRLNVALAPYVVMTRLLPILDDTPPLMVLWVVGSFLSLIVLISANLPLYSPRILYDYRYKAKVGHTIALWCQAPLVLMGTTLIISFWSEEFAFVDAYNSPYVLPGLPPLPLGIAMFNKAIPGNVYKCLIAPTILQSLVFIATVVGKVTAPDRDNDRYSDPWAKIRGLSAQPSAV